MNAKPSSLGPAARAEVRFIVEQTIAGVQNGNVSADEAANTLTHLVLSAWDTGRATGQGDLPELGPSTRASPFGRVRFELMPLLLNRARIIETDGAVVFRFW